jgi:hypothetical protein
MVLTQHFCTGWCWGWRKAQQSQTRAGDLLDGLDLVRWVAISSLSAFFVRLGK